MQQIADWLKKLGISEYADRFAEERIEIDVLSESTDQDLERLGIPLGHRRRMLRAIRERGSAPATPQVATAIPTTQRAVRGGLRLVEAVPQISTNAGSSLQVRVGIATGLVVVGDLIGTGAAQEQAVVGETPNLAARLQAHD
jgi:class 3 adenylate cyclase